METKRLVLAIVLCILLFLGWNFLSLHMGWVQPAPPPAATNATEAPLPDPRAPIDAPSTTTFVPFVPSNGRLVTVETPLYKAVFHTHGGVLREFFLKEYRQNIEPGSAAVNLVSEPAAAQAPLGLRVDGAATWQADAVWDDDGRDMALAAGETGSLRFVGEQNGVRMVRELTFSGDTYLVEEHLELDARAPRQLRVAFSFNASALGIEDRPSLFSRVWYSMFGGSVPQATESQYNITRAAWLQNGSFSEENSTKDLSQGVTIPKNGDAARVSWVAVMNNYFMGAVSMTGETNRGAARYDSGVYRASLGRAVTAAPETPARVDCVYYLGPKSSKLLADAPNELSRALDYGFFSIIASPLVKLLQFFNGFVHNYGVSIILLTLLIKIVFWPLSQKSYKSMERMRQIQPLMLQIREKHADDREAMNREIMQLYKTYKVNPAGGCLPILVQIPVFFGLYQALLNSIELRQAFFIPHLPFTDIPWLADLSAPDPLFIIPVIMALTMFLQQKMSPTTGDPTQAKIMMMMPLIFGVISLTFPAGLVIYWLANNVLSILQQWILIRRRLRTS